MCVLVHYTILYTEDCKNKCTLNTQLMHLINRNKLSVECWRLHALDCHSFNLKIHILDHEYDEFIWVSTYSNI